MFAFVCSFFFCLLIIQGLDAFDDDPGEGNAASRSNSSARTDRFAATPLSLALYEQSRGDAQEGRTPAVAISDERTLEQAWSGWEWQCVAPMDRAAFAVFALRVRERIAAKVRCSFLLFASILLFAHLFFCLLPF